MSQAISSTERLLDTGTEEERLNLMVIKEGVRSIIEISFIHGLIAKQLPWHK
jgi:hypothetical protein